MRRLTRALLCALLTSALVAGCAGSDHNDQDVAFARDMIGHHTQAVTMATMALDRTGLDPRVERLARAVRRAQTPEIDRMSGWLRSWDEPVPRHGSSSGGMTDSSAGMAGMMSAGDMRTLDRSQGATFQRRWLTMMVGHHQGALTMARKERAAGEDDAARALAGSIISSQQRQIAQMRTLRSGS